MSLIQKTADKCVLIAREGETWLVSQKIKSIIAVIEIDQELGLEQLKDYAKDVEQLNEKYNKELEA